jgi:protein phosphatase
MTERVVSWTHRTPALELRISARLQLAAAKIPFAASPSAEGGFALGLSDATGERSDVPATTMVKSMAPGDADPAPRLREAMRAASLAMPDGFAPSCSASLLYIRGTEAWVAWLGEIPVQLIRDGRVHRKIRSHRLVNELLDRGDITAEQARHQDIPNVLVRGLGGPAVEPDTNGPFRLRDGDRLVMSVRGIEIVVEVGESAPALR